MAEACGDERELRAQCQTLEQLLSSRTTTSDNTDGSRVDDSDCKDTVGVASVSYTHLTLPTNREV